MKKITHAVSAEKAKKPIWQKILPWLTSSAKQAEDIALEVALLELRKKRAEVELIEAKVKKTNAEAREKNASSLNCEISALQKLNDISPNEKDITDSINELTEMKREIQSRGIKISVNEPPEES